MFLSFFELFWNQSKILDTLTEALHMFQTLKANAAGRAQIKGKVFFYERVLDLTVIRYRVSIIKFLNHCTLVHMFPITRECPSDRR